MMKKIIILMILILSLNNVNAETIYYGDIEFSGTNLTQKSGSYDTGTTSLIWYTGFTMKNPENTVSGGVDYVICSVGYNHVHGIDGETLSSRWDSVTYKVGSTIVGTGQFGYIYNDATNTYYIGAFMDDNFDVSGYTGKTHISIIGGMTYNFYPTGFKGVRTVSINENDLGTNEAVFGYSSAGYGLGLVTGSIHRLYTAYSQNFDYTYGLSDYSYYYLNFSHTSGHDAKLTVNNGELFYSDDTFLNEHNLIINTNLTNITWVLTIENTLSDSIEHSLIMGEIPLSSATITNNQTSYTSPEIILSDITLNNPDYINNYYRVKVLYEKYSNSYDYAVVTYNQSQIISTDNIQYEIDINEDYYDLPTKFKIIVEEYNKNSGESVIIGESNIFMYNPTQYYDNIIDGYILDTTTNAYVSNVHIYYNNSLESYYDLTDSNGYFKFYLPTDLYNVHIEKNNYHDTDFSQYIDYSELTKIYITPLDEDINLYGNVLNLNTNLPLSDVKITVNNETYTQFTYSNNYGYYEFYNIQNNTNYTLIAELDNYYSFNELIVIPSDAPKYQLINLIPIIDDIDTDIDQQIEDLKEEIQPIKDLIFGLSEIVIDNPDYNNDNIISENEYASFINSLVPLVIIIFIVIMYIGLKDRREKK